MTVLQLALDNLNNDLASAGFPELRMNVQNDPNKILITLQVIFHVIAWRNPFRAHVARAFLGRIAEIRALVAS